MNNVDEMIKDFGIMFVPTQWGTMLETGISVDRLNGNMFDLSVLQRWEDECEDGPKSYVFSFQVGNELIGFGINQHKEFIEKDVKDLGEETEFVMLNDHCLEILDIKSSVLRRYSLQLVEEVLPKEKQVSEDGIDIEVIGNINVEELNLKNELSNPFDMEF